MGGAVNRMISSCTLVAAEAGRRWGCNHGCRHTGLCARTEAAGDLLGQFVQRRSALHALLPDTRQGD